VIRLANKGTFQLLRTALAVAKSRAHDLNVARYSGEEIQVDSHLVQARVELRASRSGRPTLYANLWLDGKRRGINHVAWTLDGPQT
jgi:hypothetical protein